MLGSMGVRGAVASGVKSHDVAQVISGSRLHTLRAAILKERVSSSVIGNVVAQNRGFRGNADQVGGFPRRVTVSRQWELKWGGGDSITLRENPLTTLLKSRGSGFISTDIS